MVGSNCWSGSSFEVRKVFSDWVCISVSFIVCFFAVGRGMVEEKAEGAESEEEGGPREIADAEVSWLSF